jgi:hypothetical protein
MKGMEMKDIGGMIHSVRGCRVMLDSDLAALYGVRTKELNKAVRRNQARFPEEFSFVLSRLETENLRFQIGTSSWGGRRYAPRAFTEHGVVMLSSVLNSERAVRLSIEVVKVFVRLRLAIAADRDLARRLDEVERSLEAHGKILGDNARAIRAVFEDVRALMNIPAEPKKRKIGFFRESAP